MTIRVCETHLLCKIWNMFLLVAIKVALNECKLGPNKSDLECVQAGSSQAKLECVLAGSSQIKFGVCIGMVLTSQIWSVYLLVFLKVRYKLFINSVITSQNLDVSC